MTPPLNKVAKHEGVKTIDLPPTDLVQSSTQSLENDSYIINSANTASTQPTQLNPTLFNNKVLKEGPKGNPKAKEGISISDSFVEDKKQIAATAKDKAYFNRLKGDPNLEVRLALLDNPNFQGKEWFREFETLYGDVRRLRTIVGDSFESSNIDSFDKRLDIGSLCTNLDKVLEIMAKLETNHRIRYALALNETLTEAGENHFKEDSFLPLRKKINALPDVEEIYSLIDFRCKITDLECDEGKEADERLKSFKSKLGEELYDGLIYQIASNRYIKDETAPERHLKKIISSTPLTKKLTDRLISLNDKDIDRWLLWNESYTLSGEQLALMYKAFPDELGKTIVSHKNAPSEVIQDYAHRHPDDLEYLSELAKSRLVDKYFDIILSAADKTPKEKRSEDLFKEIYYDVAKNRWASSRLLDRLVNHPGLDPKLKSLLLRNENLSPKSRKILATHEDAFLYLISDVDHKREDINEIVEKVYFPDGTTEDERLTRLQVIETVCRSRIHMTYDDIKLLEKSGKLNYIDYSVTNIVHLRYTPADVIRSFMVRVRKRVYDYDIDWGLIDKLANRDDITKDDVKHLISYSVSFTNTHRKLFELPYVDSNFIIEICQGVERGEFALVPGTPVKIHQSDIVEAFLTYRSADDTIKKYITEMYKKHPDSFDQTVITSGIFHEVLKSLSKDEAKGLIQSIAGTMDSYYLSQYYKMTDDRDKKLFKAALPIWNDIIKKMEMKGISEILFGKSLFASKGDWHLVANTTGFDDSIYRKVFEEILKEPVKTKPGGRGGFWKEEQQHLLKKLGENSSTPKDVLIALTKVLESPDDLARVAERLIKLGENDPALKAIFKIVPALKDVDNGGLKKLEAAYHKDPQTFLAALDRIIKTSGRWQKRAIARLDFLPRKYINKKLNSFDPALIRTAGQHEASFEQIYLSDYNSPYLAKRLKNASKLARSFMLNILPGLDVSEKYNAQIGKLVDQLEKIRLIDNSFLEYYILSQLYIVRDAFMRGYIIPEKRYDLLRRMVSNLSRDIHDFGRYDEARFFQNGRRTLITELLKSSIYSGHIKGQISDEDMEKWEIYFHAGAWGLKHLSEFKEISKKIDLDYEVKTFTFFFPLPYFSKSDKGFRKAVQRDIHKIIFLVARHISSFWLTPNPDIAKMAALHKDNGLATDDGISGDISIVGGVTPYGSNLEGVFIAELGHRLADHILDLSKVKRAPVNVALSMFEFDDRMAGSTVPPYLDNPQNLRDTLDAYKNMDEKYIGLAKDILSDAQLSKAIISTIEKTDITSALTRKAFWFISNAKSVLDMKLDAGYDPEALEEIVLGKGIYDLMKEAGINIPEDIRKGLESKLSARLDEISKAEKVVENFPAPVRKFMDGGDLLSTYGTAFPFQGVPARPVVGKDADFAPLEEDEQHLNAEWLTCHTKLRARVLLVKGDISYDNYIYFIKNTPLATKMRLAEYESKGMAMTMKDAAALIQYLTPEQLFKMVEGSGLVKVSLEKLKSEKAKSFTLEKMFVDHPDWSITTLEKALNLIDNIKNPTAQ